MRVTTPPDATDVALRLYHDSGRDAAYTTPTLTAGAEPGEHDADVTGLVGRFWPTLTYTLDGTPQSVDLDYVDLPDDPTLVVTPEALAFRAGIPLPLSPDDRETLVEAIEDAQADVVAYLRRPILPTTYTETGLWPVGDEWNLTLGDPVIEVLTVTAETYEDGQPSGYFTVTYTAGLDARTDPELRPIQRYLRAHALNSPEVTRLWEVTTGAKGTIKSASTEGQSVSYDKPTLGGGGKSGSGEAGSLPTQASLSRWRRLAVHQARPRGGVWPHVSMDAVEWQT